MSDHQLRGLERAYNASRTEADLMAYARLAARLGVVPRDMTAKAAVEFLTFEPHGGTSISWRQFRLVYFDGWDRVTVGLRVSAWEPSMGEHPPIGGFTLRWFPRAPDPRASDRISRSWLRVGQIQNGELLRLRYLIHTGGEFKHEVKLTDICEHERTKIEPGILEDFEECLECGRRKMVE